MPHDPPGQETASAAGAILIVEDNAINAMVLRNMLRKRGYDPVMAVDGIEGVELSNRHHPRLILMDLQMPRLDGFAAAERIIRNAGGARPAIVAVTANGGSDVLAMCREAGFASVLTKPISYGDLMATVARFMGG